MMSYSAIFKEVLTKSRDHKYKTGFLLTYGYFVHRRISVYITAFLIRFFPRVRPNHVSVLMLVCLVVGGVFLFSAVVWQVLVGFVLVYVSFLLDKVDGDLARYRALFSVRGPFLDELYHLIAPIVLVFPLLSMYWSDVPLVFFVFLVFCLGSRMVRKLVPAVYLKMSKKLTTSSVTFYKKQPLVLWPLRTMAFRIFSFVERFDVMVVLFACCFVAMSFVSYPLVWSLFLVYTSSYVIYTFRLIFLYYFGGLEDRVQTLHDKQLSFSKK